MTDVTRILNAIEGGDQKATDELLPLVYKELRILAGQKLSHEKPGQTLQAMALVHEAYVRLVGSDDRGRDGRGDLVMGARLPIKPEVPPPNPGTSHLLKNRSLCLLS